MARLRSLMARLHPRLAVVVHDLLMVCLAWYLAQWLRYWMSDVGYAAPTLLSRELPWLLLAQGLVLWWTGLYRGLWRFASLPDLANILRATVAGALAVTLVLFVVYRLEGVPRSVLLAYPWLAALALAAPRLAYRYWKDSRLDLLRRAGSTRVLVLGAGRAGEALLRDLQNDRAWRPVGLLDDNPALRGARIRGLPVLGELGQLRRIAFEVAADLLVIAIPTATKGQMQRIVGLCEGTGLPFRPCRDCATSSPAAPSRASSRRWRSRTCSAARRSNSTGRRSGPAWPGAACWSPAAAVRSAPSCAGSSRAWASAA